MLEMLSIDQTKEALATQGCLLNLCFSRQQPQDLLDIILNVTTLLKERDISKKNARDFKFICIHVDPSIGWSASIYHFCSANPWALYFPCQKSTVLPCILLQFFFFLFFP
ncbi:hypothetical protein MANES_02G064950v8 [Manihot esculenta]|uniref:Uncharacterized protein n=1 Tax=Manihot esculenta TaxID=3983 RepID=A0ACB7I5V2_MANES|nr:hypothetical protein MANES_02G064950v8 [Manihot esculenta]